MPEPCRHMAIAFAAMLLAAVAARAEPPRAEEGEAPSPETLAAFEAAYKGQLPAEIAEDARLWRQIAPSVYWLMHRSGDSAAGIDPGPAASFIVQLRKLHASRVVIGKGIEVVSLMDPTRGLDPRQVTTLCEAYGTAARVFKKGEGATLASVGDEFLEAVARLAAGGKPATVIVVGHGLPREIQSYKIPVERLAEALLPPGDGDVDLGDLTLIFDDCYSADFCLNLADCLGEAADGAGRRLVSLPVMVAGANRCQLGHANVAAKFVPHFWKEVIELLYIRRPRPEAITLGELFGRIDNAMYGYGRRPEFVRGRIVGYRVVDPELVQDPVIFVPLSAEEAGELGRRLGADSKEKPPRLLDIG